MGFCETPDPGVVSDREGGLVGNELVGGFELENELGFDRGGSVATCVVDGPSAIVPLLWTPCSLGPPCRFLFQYGTNGCPGVVGGGNAISLMDEVRELVLIVLIELVDRWIGPEIALCWVFWEGWLIPVTERVVSGGGC